MNNQTANKRQRKFLLVLPLLAFPFATFFFWSLGGGTGAQAKSLPQKEGLNIQLPAARLKADSDENKLSFYQQAEKDSLKLKEAIKDDPYYKQDSASGLNPDSNGKIAAIENTSSALHSFPGSYSSKNSLASNEAQVDEKLAILKQQLNHPQPAAKPDYSNSEQGLGDRSLQQLQEAMQKANTGTTDDPEMKQLSSMLDKIQEIQHPELVQKRLQEQSLTNKGQVYPVSASGNEHIISTLQGNNSQDFIFPERANGFYSLNNTDAITDTANAISAAVYESQTLVTGATIKLQLTNDIYINGLLIPKDNFVFGVASLSGERLIVKINSIRYRNSIFPVDLTVYDMDGAEGIYIPGAITRDVAKESADQSIQNLGFTTYDPSLGAQAASAGIAAAKTLFSRKVRLVKVTVKAGYRVLLRDEKQKQSN